ncbi:MAG: toprim domain-containing protein, partial [Deltaproteobacteria bacterium]|nr:toprim domain-containing protein [Deltaproteobacteria bacterium]
GVSQDFLTGKHGPCPMCGGKDRFRFDDKGGRGTWICGRTCGSGNGFELLIRLHRWSYQEAAQAVHGIVGGSTARQTPEATKRDPARLLARIKSECRPLTGSDPASTYLRARGLRILPSPLRYHPSLAYYDDGKHKGPFPTLVATVEGPEGDLRSLHVTYLNNGRKAAVRSARKVMPPIGTITGAAVRLFPLAEYLGLAEGIETAIAAHELFGLPVWAALNANGLERFDPPAGVRRITVFGDNDESFAGQKAAFGAAARLTAKGITTDVRLPERPGYDFLDVLCCLRMRERPT